ncbi:hypothetical protein Sjap_009467 [Stephania japonica]|uniref:C2H2-type domain-containing protein n=1 Tax=Stephania japonica TaxID=461633 RepID=A0AAP0JSY9_9MAGN
MRINAISQIDARTRANSSKHSSCHVSLSHSSNSSVTEATNHNAPRVQSSHPQHVINSSFGQLDNATLATQADRPIPARHVSDSSFLHQSQPDKCLEVEACDFCGESFYLTYACPYHPRNGNHHGSSYASPQPDFCMSRPSPQIPQQEQRTIQNIEKYMISDWLSPSTNKYPFDDWSNSSYQQDTYSSMRNQPSRDIIRYCLATVQDMNLTEQELDQWIEQRD